jgi:hypothetical protein
MRTHTHNCFSNLTDYLWTDVEPLPEDTDGPCPYRIPGNTDLECWSQNCTLAADELRQALGEPVPQRSRLSLVWRHFKRRVMFLIIRR